MAQASPPGRRRSAPAKARPPARRRSASAGQLTESAKLTISLRPTGLGEGTAEGSVPPDQAHYFITTLGMVGCAFAGIGGVALTLYIAPRSTVLPFAELAFAFTIAVLIAACGHSRVGQKSK